MTRQNFESAPFVAAPIRPAGIRMIAALVGAAAIVAALSGLLASPVFAQDSDKGVPETSIVPAGGPPSTPGAETPPPPPNEMAPPPTAPSEAAPPGEAPPPPEAGEAAPGATAAKPKPRRIARKLSATDKEVEPTEARLKILSDDWVFVEPTKWSKHIERVHANMYVNVTGSTHYYLQVKLRSGETGYLDPEAVELVKPSDKIFTLTHDAAVMEKPNRWSRKVSAVHQGHEVHAIGIALNYVKIKMRSGLEGYIPMTSLE